MCRRCSGGTVIKTPDVLVAQLTPTRRVMADDLQWIVQDLYGDKWRPVAYCRYRDTILERFLPRETHFSVVEALKALPAIPWARKRLNRLWPRQGAP